MDLPVGSRMTRHTSSTCSATVTPAWAVTRRLSRPTGRRRTEFRSQEAHCSYALCLFKVADSHLSLGEPWHALGYLEACLPLLHELGLTRHETLAREQLAHCRPSWPGRG